MFFKPFFIALSTYSAIPAPQFAWEEKSMKYAICFFPFVGLLCAAALWLWQLLEVGSLLFAAGAVCIPLLVTGGIHMDGFMDTVDALASHGSRERKLEIMKDPGCGAFAVIYCGAYLLLQLGLLSEIRQNGSVLPVCAVFVLSRCLSGLCAVTLPHARKGGMLCAFAAPAQKRAAIGALSAILLLAAAALLYFDPLQGGLMLLLAAVTALLYVAMTKKQFGGVTGDTSGFFLQVCELACMAGLWVGGLL